MVNIEPPYTELERVLSQFNRRIFVFGNFGGREYFEAIEEAPGDRTIQMDKNTTLPELRSSLTNSDILVLFPTDASNLHVFENHLAGHAATAKIRTCICLDSHLCFRERKLERFLFYGDQLFLCLPDPSLLSQAVGLGYKRSQIIFNSNPAWYYNVQPGIKSPSQRNRIGIIFKYENSNSLHMDRIAQSLQVVDSINESGQTRWKFVASIHPRSDFDLYHRALLTHDVHILATNRLINECHLILAFDTTAIIKACVADCKVFRLLPSRLSKPVNWGVYMKGITEFSIDEFYKYTDDLPRMV